MQSEMLMLYKLIILYILDRVDFPMTNAQLTDFFLEKNYTDYFTVQETLSDLLKDQYISTNTMHNRTLYHITSSGGEALTYFCKEISVTVREDIDEYLSRQQYQLKEEHATPSDYFEAKKDEYITCCKVIERDSTLIDLQLSVTTEAEAEAICNNWKDHSAEIYAYIISKLLVGSGGLK